MIDNSTKKHILEEILKSKSFANSKLNCKLLTYLIECSINNTSPSEFSIAIDVFNKDSGFNPNEDTIVRVSVYNLRKKLERYYQNMGKRTKLRVKIPKGHYEVEFFNYSKENLKDKVKNPYLILISIITLLIIIIIYLIFKIPAQLKNQNDLTSSAVALNIYSDFIKADKNTIISLGDDFLYYSDFSEFKTKSIRKMYRNSEINREEEFEKFKSEDSERDSYKKLPFSFFNQAAVWPLPHLVKIMHENNIEYRINSASTLNSNDIKANDIVFLGSFWTLGLLDPVIKDLGMSYNIIGDETLTIANFSSKDSVVEYKRTGIPAFDHIDYSAFIKIPGPNNNTILIIASFYATGSVGTIKYITEESSLEKLKLKFEEKFGEFPKHFYVIFKSTGFNREVLSTELVQLEKIDPSQIKW
ncbi:MAG: hypothetical protein JEY94_06720 [Melioribacteraceae bacterium]|nr:hypothetical protein [Melioribacteraceae bacterium]